ncbi:MAG TPA: hypothetical protein VFE23_14200 [Usitatibacter sp.]|jgi:hypothetical protein|nr:hypothetical protein [Usitatibacter sp.]
MEPFWLEHHVDASQRESHVAYGPAIFAVLAAAIAAFVLASARQPPAPATDAPTGRARCLAAQDDLHNLEWGARVFLIDEEGVRTHASAEERPVAIERARARIARFCR